MLFIVFLNTESSKTKALFILTKEANTNKKCQKVVLPQVSFEDIYFNAFGSR